MAGISKRAHGVRAAVAVALLVLGGLALAQPPAHAQAGGTGTFTRTPSSGPVGTTITVTSVTPCPVTPSDLIARPAYDSSIAYVSLLPAGGGSGPGAQVEVPPTGGPWTATLTIQPSQGHSSDPGEYVIRAGCGAYFVSPPCTPTPGSHCLPRTDGTEELLAYEPQAFHVCAAGQTGCAPASGTTTTTSPVLGNPASTTSTTLDIFGAGTSTTTASTTTAAPSATAAPTATGSPFGAVSSGVVPPGATVTAAASGFGPNSGGSVLFASTPVVIGSFTADAAGNVAQVVTVPSSAAPGQHHVIFRGTDPAGNLRDVAIPIRVQRHLPVGGTGASRTTQVGLLFLGLGLVAVGRAQHAPGRSRHRA